MSLPLYKHDLPGALIAFCGMDGSGKTSLIKALVANIEAAGGDVVTTMQPSSYARESPLFVKYMYHPELRHTIDYRAVICMLTSDRLQHIHEVVLPALREGRTVITDRYVFTAVAQMRARGYPDESWFVDICRHVPRPDLTLYLDPSFAISQERVGRRTEWRDSYIEAHHDQQLYMRYQEVVEEEGLVRIDTAADISESSARLFEVVGQALPALPMSSAH